MITSSDFVLELHGGTLGLKVTTRQDSDIVSKNISLVEEMCGQEKGPIASLSE
jgi:hypothetical protein